MFSRSKEKTPVKTLDKLNPPDGMFDDASNKFAEIYGSAIVGQSRMFVLALLLGLIALVAVVSFFNMAGKNTAVPILVEISDGVGVVNRPVRILDISPSKAVVMAELGKFCTSILTIDKDLTERLFKSANIMTASAATGQFAQFRSEQNVLTRIQKEPDTVREAKLNSIDVSQPGVAFAFVSTSENRGSQLAVVNSKWRITLKYELIPPTKESDVYVNPLGIFVTSMNIVQERN